MSNNDIWSGLTTGEKMTNHRNGIPFKYLGTLGVYPTVENEFTIFKEFEKE